MQYSFQSVTVQYDKLSSQYITVPSLFINKSLLLHFTMQYSSQSFNVKYNQLYLQYSTVPSPFFTIYCMYIAAQYSTVSNLSLCSAISCLIHTVQCHSPFINTSLYLRCMHSSNTSTVQYIVCTLYTCKIHCMYIVHCTRVCFAH